MSTNHAIGEGENVQPGRSCLKCNVFKSLDCFHAAKNGKYGKAARCKDCVMEAQHVYEKINIERNLAAGPRTGTMTCTDCGEEKSVDDFYNNLKSKHGKCVTCKKCSDKNYYAFVERNKESNKTGLQKFERKLCPRCNQEKGFDDFYTDRKTKTGKSIWCKDCVKETTNAYSADHREEARVRSRKWNKDNPARKKAAQKAHYAANPELYLYAAAKRRALEDKSTPEDKKAITDWIKKLRRMKKVACYWCSKKIPGKKADVDHIMPLSKGGAHHVENLCPSCDHCNGSKHDMMPKEFNEKLNQPRLFL